MRPEALSLALPSELSRAVEALAARDADIARELARIGHPAPRTRPPGFATLLDIIIAQQVSTRAAATLRRRLNERLSGRIDAESVAAGGETLLRSIGMSGRKAGYALALAEEVLAGRFDPEGIRALGDDEAIARIMALRGFGRWSAEIYLLFALDRGDVMPADDLALQEAARRLRGLGERPSARTLRAISEEWHPLRGAAAIFLWHLYGTATLDTGDNARKGG
ncbi:MAG: DNA-3-methyladenine glycosylase 2 family protein [Geminicoccaceae bacterium]|nr:DNA-3-methyladenine glycosylase 2 family protein [Geminicoccaceae bacterium]